jgi:hypothetical protein
MSFNIITKNFFIVSLFLVVAAVFVWAAFIRKPGRKEDRHHHWNSPKPAPVAAGKDLKEGKGPFGWGKRRKRRRKERRNPTLAETGGLPAMRADEPERPPTT